MTLLRQERRPAPSVGTAPSRRRGGAAAWSLALLILLAGSIVWSVTIGPADIGPGEVARIFLHHLGIGVEPATPLRDAIVWDGRAPRVLTAGIVGAALALAGAVMQALTRNPMADPFLLGVSAGASLAAVCVVMLGVSLLLPVAAFAGALAALVATMSLAGLGGPLSTARVVLAGLAVAQACAAGTSFVIFWSAHGDSYRDIIGWLMGSLAGTSWSSVWLTAAVLGAVGVVVLLHARTLDALVFGDVAAASLGINVRAVRWLLLTLTALLTAAMVSVSGSIGFVGLMIPHMVRMVAGSQHRILLPLSLLFGAVFMIWADTLARTIFDPREIPVGVLTAGVGAPVFAWLLWRTRGGSR